MKNLAKSSFVYISVVSVLAVFSTANTASSQGMRFQFTNPTFGGDSFNSSHLLSLADIQNRHIDDGFEADEELSEEDLFARQLESTLLFSLSDSLAEVITGAEQNSSETFTIGNQEIKYSRGTDPENGTANIVVEIKNLLDFSTTIIELPVIANSF